MRRDIHLGTGGIIQRTPLWETGEGVYPADTSGNIQRTTSVGGYNKRTDTTGGIFSGPLRSAVSAVYSELIALIKCMR